MQTSASGTRSSLWSSLGRSRFAVLALTLLALGALVPGLTLPILYLRRGLAGETYSVLTGVVDLADGGNVLLALIVFAFSVVFPIAKLTALLAILFARLTEERREGLLRSLSLLGRWSMLDVFVIAILVGAVQLGVLSNGESRSGLYVFAAAILLSMIAAMTIERVAAPDIVAAEVKKLRTSGRRGRWISSAACALFLIGLALPIMSVEKWLFWDNQYSVLTGTWSLVGDGQAALALTVLLFVVVLPLARFVGLAWVQWRAPTAHTARAIVFVDTWAMLDVFGLALLIVIVKIGDIASVSPRPGFWVLLAAVGLSLYDSWRLRRGED